MILRMPAWWFIFWPIRCKKKYKTKFDLASSCASTPQEPPNSRTRASPDPEFTSEATPSCCYDFSSSSPPAGEDFVVIDGPLPAGVQPLCDFNSSSSSSPPPMQTGLIGVDDPSPADGLGSHGNASTAEMSPDSAHTHPDAPSSVCKGMDCTGSSSDGSAAGRPIFQIFALVLQYEYSSTRFAYLFLSHSRQECWDKNYFSDIPFLGYFFPLCSLLACPGFWLVFGLSYFGFTLFYFILLCFFSELWLSFPVWLFLRFPLHFVCFILFLFLSLFYLFSYYYFVLIFCFCLFRILSSNVFLLLTYVCCACRTQY